MDTQIDRHRDRQTDTQTDRHDQKHYLPTYAGGRNVSREFIELTRFPTRPGKPGKPGKRRVHLENLEISLNFEKFNKYHGKTT